MVVAEKQRALGRASARALARSGRDSLFVPTDVADPGSVEHMVGTVLERCGRIDCLVNNQTGSRVGVTVLRSGVQARARARSPTRLSSAGRRRTALMASGVPGAAGRFARAMGRAPHRGARRSAPTPRAPRPRRAATHGRRGNSRLQTPRPSQPARARPCPARRPSFVRVTSRIPGPRRGGAGTAIARPRSRPAGETPAPGPGLTWTSSSAGWPICVGVTPRSTPAGAPPARRR
jgi:NAD(P)-dependent dehydrogenase (short-subunit alcohol dehydrogenase family)